MILYDSIKSRNPNFRYLPSSFLPSSRVTLLTLLSRFFLSTKQRNWNNHSYSPSSLPPSTSSLTIFHPVRYLHLSTTCCSIILTHFTFYSHFLLTSHTLYSLLCFLFANLIYILVRYLVQQCSIISITLPYHPSLCTYVRSSILPSVRTYVPQ